MVDSKVISLIFDLDNTLCRCSDYYIAAESSFAKLMHDTAGIEESIALSLLKAIDIEHIKIDGFGRDRFPKSFKAASVSIDIFMDRPIDHKRADDAWQIGNAVFSAPYPLYDGIYKSLEVIQQNGYNMFLLTKGDIEVQKRKIVINKLDKFFSDQHIYIYLRKSKEHFDQIVEDNGLQKKHTVSIGDSLKDDMAGALAAGLHTVHVSKHHQFGWGYEDSKNVKPEFTIETVSELPKLLLSKTFQTAISK